MGECHICLGNFPACTCPLPPHLCHMRLGRGAQHIIGKSSALILLLPMPARRRGRVERKPAVPFHVPKEPQACCWLPVPAPAVGICPVPSCKEKFGCDLIITHAKHHERWGRHRESIRTLRFNFRLPHSPAQRPRTSPSPAYSMSCGDSTHFTYIYLNISITKKWGFSPNGLQ